MAIALRSNSPISYPIQSAGAFTAGLAVRDGRERQSPNLGIQPAAIGRG